MHGYENANDHNFSWAGLPSDWVPVTPNSGGTGQLTAPSGAPQRSASKEMWGIGVKVTVAGDVVVRTPWGVDRTIPVAVGEQLPIAVAGIKDTSTATGIFVAVVY